MRLRVSLWLVAWGVAFTVTSFPLCISHPGQLPSIVKYAWIFPLGLVTFVVPARQELIFTSLIAGWLFYIALTVFGLLQRRRLRYFIVYAILCLLLILNVIGCNVNKPESHWHM